MCDRRGMEIIMTIYGSLEQSVVLREGDVVRVLFVTVQHGPPRRSSVEVDDVPHSAATLLRFGVGARSRILSARRRTSDPKALESVRFSEPFFFWTDNVDRPSSSY